jgi:hypothetical protein
MDGEHILFSGLGAREGNQVLSIYSKNKLLLIVDNFSDGSGEYRLLISKGDGKTFFKAFIVDPDKMSLTAEELRAPDGVD